MNALGGDLGIILRGIPTLAGSFLSIFAFSLLFGEYLALVGRGALRATCRLPDDGLMQAGAGWLAGLAVLGLAWFALALAGLYSAVPLAVSALALGAASFRRSDPLPVVWRAVRELGGLGTMPAAMLAAGIVPLLFFVLVPSFEQDAYIYHLGAPWQFLVSHRLVCEMVPVTYQHPLPVEMTFVLPLLLGDTRMAVAIVAMSFLAFGAVVISLLGRGSSVRFAWPAVLLALSLPVVLRFIFCAKNDVAAAVFFAAGALFWESGFRTAGAVMFGACLAAKWVYGPAVAIWFLVLPPRGLRGWTATLVLSAVFLAPWWMKNWLEFNNPLFLFGWRVLDTFQWAQPNDESFMKYVRALELKDTLHWWTLPAAWFGYLRREFFVLALLLPMALVFRPTRKAALACLAAQLVILGASHNTRFLMGPGLALLVLTVRALSTLALPVARHLPTGLAAAGLAALWFNPGIWRLDWRWAFTPPAKVDRDRNAGYGEAVREVLARHPRRLLLVGELRTFPLPGRVLYGGALGETPVVWKAVRESADLRALCRKMRQINPDYLLFNYISMEWVQKYTGDSFGWDERMFGLYVEYVRRYLAPVWDTGHSDYINGGFYLYRVRRSPLRSPPRLVLLAPNAEPIYQETFNLELAGRTEESLAPLKVLVEKYPQAMFLRSQLAYLSSKAGRWGEALAVATPAYKAGLRDGICVPTYALALAAAGRADEAYPLLKDCMKKYPFTGATLYTTLAAVLLNKAYRAMIAGRPADAAAHLRESEETLAVIRPGLGPKDVPDWNKRMAMTRIMQGALAAWIKDCAHAFPLFNEGLRLTTDLPNIDQWRKVLVDNCGEPAGSSPGGLFRSR